MSEASNVEPPAAPEAVIDDPVVVRAYHAYASVTDWKNFRGDPMPQFVDLPEPIKRAWAAAVASVLQ